ALVSAGFFALFHERLGMIGVFDSCMPLVPADMAGNALVTPRETQTIGIRCPRQGVASVLRGDGRAVGLDGQTTWAGGADLGHGGDIDGRPRHGASCWPLGVPSRDRWLPGFAMAAHSGPGLEPVPGGGIAGAEVGALEASEARLLHVPDAVLHPAFFLPLADMTRGAGKAVVWSKVEIC